MKTMIVLALLIGATFFSAVNAKCTGLSQRSKVDGEVFGRPAKSSAHRQARLKGLREQGDGALRSVAAAILLSGAFRCGGRRCLTSDSYSGKILETPRPIRVLAYAGRNSPS
jgi:hypothetical protein